MKNKILLKACFLLTFLISNCNFINPQNKTSGHFKFKMDNTFYAIGSVSSIEKEKSYNQLVGINLVAVDLDRDGVIDQIKIGNQSLSDAQNIYGYGLSLLAAENKLSVQDAYYSHYFQKNTNYNYQIKSFQPSNDIVFNEFKITNKENEASSEIILIDRNADGNLDEVLKGTSDAITYQSNYDYVLITGLENNKLFKSGDRILVK